MRARRMKARADGPTSTPRKTTALQSWEANGLPPWHHQIRKRARDRQARALHVPTRLYPQDSVGLEQAVPESSCVCGPRSKASEWMRRLPPKPNTLLVTSYWDPEWEENLVRHRFQTVGC